MQQTHHRDAQPAGGPAALAEAARIPHLSHPEAAEMATVELERFLACVESLAPADSGG